ncbi:hypothetical protein [Nonomuraea sp. NPDC048826]|uniref:hypothetical protein n=1 Tax=Nonomuraea sp. NPDC048826 TaxID=3364347 RepID=UPI0037161656
MKRVMKTAVAVTAFGLAAALAVPAQAQTKDPGGSQTTRDEPGSGKGPAGLGSLLGGLTGGGLLNGLGGGLLGGLLGGRSGAPAQPAQPPQQQQQENQRPGRSEMGPAIDGLTSSLPLGGLASSHQSKRKTQVKPQQDATLQGAFASVADLVEGSLGGAMASLSTTKLLPGGAVSVTQALDSTTEAVNGTTQGVDHLSVQDTVTSVSRAAKFALPQSTNGRLGPLIGQLAPAEAAPLLESLPGTTQVASIDEIAPLVEDASALVSTNGTKASGAYTDTIASLGWATAALTSAVQDPWHHR